MAGNGKVVTKTDADGNTKYKCQYCGKCLSREESLENESGDYCHHLREQGMDTSYLKEHRQRLTVADVPEGYIKLASLDRICKKEGIPISRMVRAIGGDRALSEPIREEFRPIYVGNARYVDGWCASEEGLDFLRNLSGGSPRKAKKAAEVDELEELLASVVTVEE